MKFFEVSRCSRAKQRQGNVQKKKKKCAVRAQFFSNETNLFFGRLFLLPSPLSIKVMLHRTIFSATQRCNVETTL